MIQVPANFYLSGPYFDHHAQQYRAGVPPSVTMFRVGFGGAGEDEDRRDQQSGDGDGDYGGEEKVTVRAPAGVVNPPSRHRRRISLYSILKPLCT